LVFSHGASFTLPAVFSHGAGLKPPPDLPRLFCSYHPSQQNTQTGRLTPEMFQQVLRDISDFLGS
jgi:uracil-DNA glycosylase